MKNSTYINFFVAFLSVIYFAGTGCHKKTVPSNASSKVTVTSKGEPTTSTPVKKVKTPVPAVIVVNDDIARKTVDGRLYYDLNGKRYWKNYKDGKYYLFNKKMYDNPDFTPR
ncbi:MAG: hypothetical protein JST81_01115 [Bacteroidetes bacterium]|nr:hypothetical protein [Bacteroidota bacterium]